MTEDRAITVVEAPPSGGAIGIHSGAGTLALAMLSEQEFGQRLAALKQGRKRIEIIQRELMEKDTDFGTIPGTQKPTLYKPGAEKLCDFYRYVPTFISERVLGDGTTSPTITFLVTAKLHLGSEDGPVVGSGVGSCNSWEKRYRYRTAERACPKCGNMGSVNHSKSSEGGWYCWAKKSGCGATFPENTPAITDQQLGMIDNPDPYDLDNTLFKMATKRAYVDATLRTTATSGLFMQDLDDLVEDMPTAPRQASATRPAAPQPQRPAPQTPPPTAAPAASGLAPADDWTTFWTTTKKLGYADAKAVNAALGVSNINDWINHGGTQASAIDILTKLAG